MNSLTKHEPTEVLDPQQSAEILARCERQITTLHEQLGRGEKLNQGIRFLIGAEMIAARPHIPLAGRGNTGDSSDGDGFENWVASKWPSLSKTSAFRYMKLASTVLAVAPKCKSSTVELLQNLPKQLVQSEFELSDEEKIFEAVALLTEGKSDAEFIKEHNPPKHPNPCEHCGKPVHPAAVKCSHCGKSITPKLTAAQIAESERLMAKEWVNIHLGRINTLLESPTLAGQISDANKEIILAAHARVGEFLRGKLGAKQNKAMRGLIEQVAAGSDDMTRAEARQEIKRINNLD